MKKLLIACLTVSLSWAGWFSPSLSAQSSQTQAETTTPIGFLFIQPGSPGSTEEAAPLLQRFADYVAAHLPPHQRLSGTYVNALAEARDATEMIKPRFAIVTLPYYLQYRQADDLIVQLFTRPGGATEDRYRLLVATDNPASSWETLHDATVAGTLCHSADAIARLMFAHSSAAKLPFRCEPTDRLLRASRKVARGELGGILVTATQYESLRALPVGQQLRVLYATPPLPTPLVVSFGPPDAHLHAILNTLLGMKDDPAARALLNDLRTDGFSPFDPNPLYQLTKEFDRLAPDTR